MPAQDGPDARRSQNDTHPHQRILDPAIAPGGILPGQLQDDRNGASGDAWSTWVVGVGPLAPDEVPMPPKQGLGLDEESPQAPVAKVTTQSGEQRSVRGPQRRSDHLTTEDRDLVAEHDDLDRQYFAVVPRKAEQFEDSDEGNVEKRQGHGPVSSYRAVPRKCCSVHPDDILGTHRFLAPTGRPPVPTPSRQRKVRRRITAQPSP